jgi:coenzyme F420-reducing hydrogenase delta subunit/Pyruvate/2-oxoacid:ferredoxin oxidoreductase delta subunit
MPLAAASIRRLDRAFDAAFGAAADPLKQLGALAVAFFALLAMTGVVLYAALDTSVAGAWRSIDDLSREPASAGAIVRSLHRYAADAFVLVTLVHLAREWSLGRFKAFRRFSWWTGVVLLPFLFACAIVGFWLQWDRLAQYSALATAEWLDALPLFATPFARNFLAGVDDRLFSLLVFVHVGLPLLLVFGVWMHVQRIARPRIVPRRALAAGTAAALLLLAVLVPVRGGSAADLASVPGALALDWLLLFVHPLADATSNGFAWALVAAAFALLLVLPLRWLRLPRPVARVDAAHCSGCRHCADDCPYGAITMVAHPLRGPGVLLPQVDPLRCASCGICVGACPSATPTAHAALRPGIDLPDAPLAAVQRRLAQALAQHPGSCVVFACSRSARVAQLASATVLPISLDCAGALPAAFVDEALRRGAAGVVVAGCREGGCEYRFGQDWTAQRLAGGRLPRLRPAVPRRRWSTVWADAGEEARVAAAVSAMHAAVRTGAP